VKRPSRKKREVVSLRHREREACKKKIGQLEEEERGVSDSGKEEGD